MESGGGVGSSPGHGRGLLGARRSVLGVGATFADAAATFWTPARFVEAWGSARPPYLLTTRVPAQSIAAQLPPESVRLLSIQNGRWLSAHAPAPPSSSPPPPSPSLIPPCSSSCS